MKQLITLIGLVLLIGVGVFAYSYAKNTSPITPTNEATEMPSGVNTSEHDILQLFATKYNKATNDIRLTFTDSDATHMRGSVSFAPFGSANESGMFLATKVNGTWKLVYDGNGSVDCNNLAQYDFSASMLTGFCD